MKLIIDTLHGLQRCDAQPGLPRFVLVSPDTGQQEAADEFTLSAYAAQLDHALKQARAALAEIRTHGDAHAGTCAGVAVVEY